MSGVSRSGELYERARKVMPGGNTRTTVFTAPYPTYIAAAQGATVTDVEGTSRVDYVNNYTSLIHGHAHPQILEAVRRQLPLGTAMSFPTAAEIALAETIVARVDSIDQVRFTNSGTEAVMMAVQAARAFTGRRKVAKFEGCYHGAYLEESAGNPSDEFVHVPFNDIEAVEHALSRNDVAAIVVDPLPHRPGFIDPRPGFLERLSTLARDRGALLISDEIISFRVSYNGPQRRYGYSADLTTLAKIIGGGFPVGAFGGRADVMAVFDPTRTDLPRVPHGGTFNANPVTMVAGQAAMHMLTPAAFDQLAALGERVRTGLADLIETRDLKWQVSGEGSLFKLHPHTRPLLDFRSTHPTPEEQATLERVYQGLFGAGVVVTPELAGCVSTPMTEHDVDTLLSAAEQVLGALV